MKQPRSELSRRSFLQGGTAAALGGLVAAPLARGMRRTARSRKPVRIGVVGGGFGCSFHWHQDPRCEVVAVSDLRPERRKRLQDVYGCQRAWPSLKELLGDEEVNAVAIFTEAPNHVRHCTAVMESGRDVICACPAALTLADCRRLVEVKRRTGRKYMMAETSWYRYETIVARGLYRKGAFGRLLYCEGEYYHPGICHAAHPLSHHGGKRTWRYGYPPMLYPTHTTAFLIGVSGERLRSVSCLGTRSADPAFAENDYDNPFCNGAGLFRTSSENTFRGNVFWQIYADGERAQWIGEEGALYMAGSGGQPFRFRSRGHGELDKVPDTWSSLPAAMRIDSGHGGAHPHLTHEFVSALAEDREPVIDVYQALAITAPGIVAHRSALEGGRRLEIPDFDAPR